MLSFILYENVIETEAQAKLRFLDKTVKKMNNLALEYHEKLRRGFTCIQTLLILSKNYRRKTAPFNNYKKRLRNYSSLNSGNEELKKLKGSGKLDLKLNSNSFKSNRKPKKKKIFKKYKNLTNKNTYNDNIIKQSNHLIDDNSNLNSKGINNYSTYYNYINLNTVSPFIEGDSDNTNQFIQSKEDAYDSNLQKSYENDFDIIEPLALENPNNKHNFTPINKNKTNNKALSSDKLSSYNILTVENIIKHDFHHSSKKINNETIFTPYELKIKNKQLYHNNRSLSFNLEKKFVNKISCFELQFINNESETFSCNDLIRIESSSRINSQLDITAERKYTKSNKSSGKYKAFLRKYIIPNFKMFLVAGIYSIVWIFLLVLIQSIYKQYGNKIIDICILPLISLLIINLFIHFNFMLFIQTTILYIWGDYIISLRKTPFILKIVLKLLVNNLSRIHYSALKSFRNFKDV